MIGRDTGPALVRRVEDLIERQSRLDDFFESALQVLIDDGVPVGILDIGDRVAVEIDFPDDFRLAERLLREGRSPE